MACLSSARPLAGVSFSVLFVAILVACGGTTTTIATQEAGTSDAGPTDSAADAATIDGATPTDGAGPDGAGGCVSLPAEGTACIPGQISCDRVDLCCASAATCDATTKKWKLSAMACLLCPTHGCGDKTCAGTQMCIAHAPGVPGGQPTYECAAYPAACAREWTCGCVEKNLPAGCTLAVNGCSDADLPVKVACMGI